MREAALLALAEELERHDLPGWAQRVQNVLGDFVFPAERPDMAIPLRYIEHLQANGPRGRGTTLTDPAIAGGLTDDLRAQGYRAVRAGDAGFEDAFARFMAYYDDIARQTGNGNRDSRQRYVDRYTFWLPPKGADRAAVLHAMARFAAGEMPPGRGNARKWFVRHPETGDYLPAKIIWGLATGLTDFNAHQARDGLRRLGFDVPGPDQPAAEIAESPESLAALPPAFEGAERQVTRNIRERDPAARRAAEAHWRQLRGGLISEGCGIDFGRAYGPRGAGFMHFHHLTPLAAAEGPRAVDGARDLVPLCPNCHAMVHRGEDLLTIDALRALLGLPPQQL